MQTSSPLRRRDKPPRWWTTDVRNRTGRRRPLPGVAHLSPVCQLASVVGWAHLLSAWRASLAGYQSKATTDSRRPTADKRRPTSEAARPTSHGRRPTVGKRMSEDRRLTADDRRPMTDEQQATSDERPRLANDRRPAADDRRPAIHTVAGSAVGTAPLQATLHQRFASREAHQGGRKEKTPPHDNATRRAVVVVATMRACFRSRLDVDERRHNGDPAGPRRRRRRHVSRRQ